MLSGEDGRDAVLVSDARPSAAALEGLTPAPSSAAGSASVPLPPLLPFLPPLLPPNSPHPFPARFLRPRWTRGAAGGGRAVCASSERRASRGRPQLFWSGRARGARAAAWLLIGWSGAAAGRTAPPPPGTQAPDTPRHRARWAQGREPGARRPAVGLLLGSPPARTASSSPPPAADARAARLQPRTQSWEPHRRDAGAAVQGTRSLSRCTQASPSCPSLADFLTPPRL